MQQGEPHPGANFDDAFFIVNKVQKFSREEVLVLSIAVAADKDQLEYRLEDDPFDRELKASIKRKKRQLQWCHARICIIKAEAKLKIAPEVRAARRDNFYEGFFFACQDDLPKAEFSRLCKLAEAQDD